MLDEFRSTYITWDKATRRIYSPVTANESDSNGRKLNIQVVNSGQVENLTGTTLHLYWETKDKLHDGLDAFDASDISKGEFELFYTTGMLSNVGELNATLVLVDSTGKVVSDWFKITVTRGINEGAIESENSFSSLTQALIDISNLEQNYAPRLNDLTAQLQQTEQSLNTQLADKTKQTDFLEKKSNLYERALQEMGVPVNALHSAKLAAAKGTLRIAIGGDSIAEGADQVLADDAYVNKVIKLLQLALPQTSIVFQNFSLSGQKIENFVDSGYVAVASQGGVIDRQKQFYRPWSTVGKTWMQHVKEFEPDLFINAWGMNSSDSATASYKVATAMETIINEFAKTTSNPSIVIVTPMLPTTNSVYYTQSQTITQSVARALREVALKHNLAIVDANRLYCILRDGVDDVTRNAKRYDLGADKTFNGKFLNGEIFFNYTESSGSVVRLDYRKWSDVNGIAIIAVTGTSGNVAAYSAKVGTSSILIKQTSAINVPTNGKLRVVCEGSQHTVYLDNVLVLAFETFHGLSSGIVEIVTNNAINTFSVINKESAYELPRYTELELLGEYDDIYLNKSGNGINHPTGLGHSLFYVPPFYKIIDELRKLPTGLQTDKVISGSWEKSSSAGWGLKTDEGLDLYFFNMGQIGYNPTLAEQVLLNSTGDKYTYNLTASAQGKVHLLKTNEYAYALDPSGIALLFIPSATAITDTFTLKIKEPL